MTIKSVAIVTGQVKASGEPRHCSSRAIFQSLCWLRGIRTSWRKSSRMVDDACRLTYGRFNFMSLER